MTTRTYLGIGAARIQTWLTRTPELALMRGASKALREATANSEIDAFLERRTDVHEMRSAEDGGDIDGVVVLETKKGGKTIAPAEALAVARLVLHHLAASLPGIEWEVWTCDAESYVQAYAAHLDEAAAVTDLTWLPALPEVPLARACPGCRREASGPGEETAGKDTERLDAGADCAARNARPRTARAAEQGDQTTSQWAGIPGRVWAQDFDELARGGGVVPQSATPQAHGRKDSRNHLATIVADGNAIGQFFELVARDSHGLGLATLRAVAVAALNAVASQAVVRAGMAISPPAATIKAVLPHFVGGDDIFVSVPAPLAWTFATTLAEAFEELSDVIYAKAPDPAGFVSDDDDTRRSAARSLLEAINGISLGIGICFAHASHPIADTHAEAERAMARAKRHTRGREAAIGWVDLTEGLPLPTLTEATTPKPTQLVVQSAAAKKWLTGSRRPDVFTLTPSGRSRLGAVLRHHRTSARAQQQAVDTWATRLGIPLTTPVADLPMMLSLARWWPSANQDEHDEEGMP